MKLLSLESRGDDRFHAVYDVGAYDIVVSRLTSDGKTFGGITDASAGFYDVTLVDPSGIQALVQKLISEALALPVGTRKDFT